MFRYYLDLALRSLKRSPGLTALMVLSIGIGVALAMTTWTLQHVMARDPIPQKSMQIYFPTIDMWGPAAHAKATNGSDPPDSLDYGTAEALLRDHRATYQSAVFPIQPAVVTPRADVHPFHQFGFAVNSEFFPMLAVPFRFPSGCVFLRHRRLLPSAPAGPPPAVRAGVDGACTTRVPDLVGSRLGRLCFERLSRL